jgi:NAD(P)H-flavin reductase/hemoglobin-like flavoprotein
VQLFYARFFLLAPQARDLFEIDMSRQRDHLLQALTAVVATADNPGAMRAKLAGLGADHRKFDARPGHYDAAGAALIGALRDVAGPAWTQEMTAAWESAIVRTATIMRDAAAERAGTPAYWTATVIVHERHGSDVAIIRVQPDQPYMYRGGQYVTLKLTERGYDSWRPMSIASAPRADNTLDFYVRAIPGGLVSPALVAHTRVGDTLHLGPPLGGPLVADPAYTSGLVCIGGGVGSSAIKAVVEQVARWKPPIPPVHAYIGMRRVDDLPVAYDLARTASGIDAITVTTIASDEPATYPGPRGLVGNYAADAEGPGLARTGWDVFVAGPPPMIDHCVRRFTDLGVPRSRIHSDFDDYGLAGVT